MAQTEKTCSQCDNPAVKWRNETNLCIVHYRMQQMRHDSQNSKKTVPTKEELDQMVKEIIEAGTICPICKRKMNWTKPEGISTILTLQHDRSGKYRIICLRCNVRHQFSPGDTFFDWPEGMKQCRDCLEIKPFSEFYPHKRYPNGYRADCKRCCIRKAVGAKSKKRKEARNATSGANAENT